MEPKNYIKAKEEILKLIQHEEEQIKLIEEEAHTDDMRKLFINGHKQNIAVFNGLLKKYYTN